MKLPAAPPPKRDPADARMRRPANTVLRPLLACVLVALLLVVNAVALLVVDRFALKLDMTDNRLYELSSATDQTLQGITQPVQITVFGREEEFPALLREILARYAALSRNISVRYREPFAHPALAQTYTERGENIELNDVVVETGSSFRRLGIKDMYTLNASGTQLATVRAEQQVTGAIAQLLNPRKSAVRFTDGHDEHPSNALMAFFERNNYQVARTNLSIETLDDAVDMVVLVAPTLDFSAQEIAAMESHLDRGGSVMVFLASTVHSLPRLEGLLERWGIGGGSALVREPRAHVSDNPLNIVPMYAPHPINTLFGSKRSFLVMPGTRVVRVQEKPSFDLDVMTVLSSTPEARARTGSDADAVTPSASDDTGPFALAVTAVRKPPQQQRTPTDSAGGMPAQRQAGAGRIFLSGSEKMVSDDVLKLGNFANGEFLAQTVYWLNPRQQTVQIPGKQIAPDPLAIRTGDATWIAVVLTAVLPSLVLLAGALVMLQRRRLQ